MHYCWAVYVLLPGLTSARKVPVDTIAAATQALERPWFVITGMGSHWNGRFYQLAPLTAVVNDHG